MLTKEEKLKLKPTTEKLKAEFIKLSGKAVVNMEGVINPDFMFWVVARYENILKKLREVAK